jgi:hypothetical protein
MSLRFSFAGNTDAYVAAVEFSDTNITHIPPTKRSLVDATMLRRIDKQSGFTNMYAGLAACQSLLEEQPMKSTGSSKVIVLLTDGGPDSREDAMKAADMAKAAGTAITTIGVANADLSFMATLSSGPGYNFSTVAFDNDAANIGAEVAPKVCSPGGAGKCHIRTMPTMRKPLTVLVAQQIHGVVAYSAVSRLASCPTTACCLCANERT